MDWSSISLFFGLVTAALGIASFVAARMQRAEQNGKLEEKVTQCFDGITTLNKKLDDAVRGQTDNTLQIRTHDEQIKTIFKNQNDTKEFLNIAKDMRDSLRDIAKGNREK